jgi:hypothetical protein
MTFRIAEKIAIQAGTAADEAVTKTQLDTGVADAKNRANHTGTQTAATISDFTTAVNALITAVIDGAPGALDTLNELAAALGDDPNFAATLTTQLGALDTRLDALEGAPSGSRSMTATIGDNAASSFNIDHGWALANKNKVRVEIVDTVDGATVLANVTRTTVNRVVVSFGSAVPTAGQYLVLLNEVTG